MSSLSSVKTEDYNKEHMGDMGVVLQGDLSTKIIGKSILG